MHYLLHYRKWFIIITSFFFNSVLLYSQQGGGIFYHLTTANGLSSNRTTSVMQDRYGFYWIATLDGLNRFDGTSCKIFQHIEEDSASLSHNNCISFLEDDKGDIWIATLMGLNRYRNNEGKFDHFFLHNPRENFERVNWIRGMTKDDAGNIWITSCGVWQYNIYTGKWKKWLHDPDDSTSLPDGIIAYPVYDKKTNGIWMSGFTSFIFLDLATAKIYHRKHNPKHLSLLNDNSYGSPVVLDKDNNIWFFRYEQPESFFRYSTVNNTIQSVPLRRWRGIFNMNMDDKNRIWIHFWHGPSYIFDPSDRSLDSVFLDHYHSQSAISNNANNIFIDKTGNYWISTPKGISIFNPRAQAVKYYLLNDNRKNTEGGELAITNIAEQNDSIIWVGTSAGLYQYNLYQRKFLYMDKLQLHIKGKYVHNLFFQNDSVLWIAGWGEFFGYNVTQKKLISPVHYIVNPQCITADPQGNVWVGTWDNGLYEFSASGQLIKQLLPDTNATGSVFSNHLVCFGSGGTPQEVWIGYNGGDGFSNFNYPNRQFRHYKIKKSKGVDFATYAINCIREDDKKNLWIGTFGRGLIYFNPANDSFQTFMQGDGLKGNFVNTILADDSSRLWISTTTGLNILDTRTRNMFQTDIDLNFSGNDFVDNGIVRKNKKFLFFAGNRIVEIEPGSYYQTKASSEILLASFKIFDKETYLSISSADKAAVNLSYYQNFFSIAYSLLKSNPNSTAQYAYQLQGFDKDWNYVKERQTAYYTNVPPGQYEFLVKATDENGNWTCFSKPLFITITPSFWQQWWFYALIGLGAAILLYLIYRYRIGQLKRMMELRTKISQDLHDEVGATLSGVALFSEIAGSKLNEGNQSETKLYLERIATHAKEMVEKMSDIVWAINPQNDSFEKVISKLQAYASLLCTGKKIKLYFEADDSIRSQYMNMQQRKNVYLIIKEALNNAVKYSNCRELFIKLEKNHHQLQIVIKDDGHGFDTTSANNGNGIKNMKGRARELKAELKIDSNPEEGTLVQLHYKFTLQGDSAHWC